MFKKMMMVLLIVAAMVGTATATMLFEEDFTNSATASARFDKTNTLGWTPWPAFANGVVTLSTYSGGHTSIRTNAANNFLDDGLSGPVVYSTVMNRQAGKSGGVFNSLYARLGTSGFSSGYQLRIYCDSNSDASYNTGSIALFRSGTLIFSSGTLTPMPAVFAPTVLSLTLENTAGSVDWTIQYGSYSTSGSDTDAARITSGVGAGCYLMSNGGAYFVPTDYDNLKVEVVPEPATVTLLIIGGLTMLRRKP